MDILAELQTLDKNGKKIVGDRANTTRPKVKDLVNKFECLSRSSSLDNLSRSPRSNHNLRATTSWPTLNGQVVSLGTQVTVPGVKVEERRVDPTSLQDGMIQFGSSVIRGTTSLKVLDVENENEEKFSSQVLKIERTPSTSSKDGMKPFGSSFNGGRSTTQLVLEEGKTEVNRTSGKPRIVEGRKNTTRLKVKDLVNNFESLSRSSSLDNLSRSPRSIHNLRATTSCPTLKGKVVICGTEEKVPHVEVEDRNSGEDKWFGKVYVHIPPLVSRTIVLTSSKDGTSKCGYSATERTNSNKVLEVNNQALEAARNFRKNNLTSEIIARNLVERFDSLTSIVPPTSSNDELTIFGSNGGRTTIYRASDREREIEEELEIEPPVPTEDDEDRINEVFDEIVWKKSVCLIHGVNPEPDDFHKPSVNIVRKRPGCYRPTSILNKERVLEGSRFDPPRGRTFEEPWWRACIPNCVRVCFGIKKKCYPPTPEPSIGTVAPEDTEMTDTEEVPNSPVSSDKGSALSRRRGTPPPPPQRRRQLVIPLPPLPVREVRLLAPPPRKRWW